MALTIYLIYCVFARKLVVDGYSMEPNFHDGDTLFVNTIAYISKEPNRFDVIALRSENRDYIKRIIGLPGETLWINENGEVCINNLIINDPSAVLYACCVMSGKSINWQNKGM